MPFIINQDITIYCIKNIMSAICIVFTSIDSTEPEANELIVYFLFRCQSRLGNKRLYQHSTHVPIAVLSKTKHTIGTGVKIPIMGFYAFKERCEIIVGITKIVQFDNLLCIGR